MTEVAEALTSAGRDDLARHLASASIQRCTYDPTVDAGYVYLVRSKTSPHFSKLAAQVAETVPFLEVGFNVDVDYDGNVYGIELLSRGDFFAKLREANAL